MMNEYGASGKIIQLMAQITIRSRRISEYLLKPTGLTFPQVGTLIALRDHPGMSQKEMAMVLQTDTTTIMVVCDALEKKGYVRRMPSPLDRRANRVEITDSGIVALEQAFPLVYTVFGPLMATFSDEESAMVIPILEKAYQRVCQLEEENSKRPRDHS
jgi:DNA-binding MarR family transcriptional regulator